MKRFIYENVTVVRVIDGDTVTLAIDMGNKITWTDNFRLMGIDTPERGQPNYREATDELHSMVLDGLRSVETHKPDKYGRWLATLTGHNGTNINQAMLDSGLAKPYGGGAR